MREFIDNISDRMLLWSMKGNEVSQIDGIVLCDIRKRGDSFRPTIERALQLIRQHDLRRYGRVQQHISRIANQILKPGTFAEYHFRLRTVFIEFDDFPRVSSDVRAAFYACALIHEATHGELAAKGIVTTAENRGRIERLCVTEQNRFAARLAAEDGRYKLRQVDFKESYWSEAWNTGHLKQATSMLWRTVTDTKPKQNDDA